MTAETVQYVYWIGSLILLSSGTAMLGVTAMFMTLIKVDAMYIAFIPVFIADAFTILNFLPRDIYHIVTGSLDSGGWCKFSAFWTISCCVALNANAAAIAYFTNDLVNDKFRPDIARRKVLLTTAVGWIVGIVMASGFMASDFIGDFRGLYCCLSRIQGVKIFLPYFLVTSVAFSFMLVFYRKAFNTVVMIHDRVKASLSPGASPQQQGSVSKTPEHIRGLVVMSSYMVGSFYTCWFLVVFLAFLETCGVTYGIEWDVLAGWCLKLQPILDSIVVIRGAAKMIKNKSVHNSAVKPSKDAPLNVSNGDIPKRFNSFDAPRNTSVRNNVGRLSNTDGRTELPISVAELLPSAPGIAASQV
eukprot:TRINITY_DN1387_c0_g1_i1.p1 TRINITY_DN1387_c0_g1~~TRINITY_DN1387_c0_g1_i1.p1  ORF type:complete len:358 (+),score=93.65 TRINITY_DN1387_c0_g1_i1:187-1260(+)